MFAYIDETGNSGKNIFDPQQPVFMTAALLTKRNFDFFYTDRFRALASIHGKTALHANELGIGRLEEVAGDLFEIISSEKSRFFMSSIDKNYLATSKLVDTLFDSYENKAVPWHAYNIRVLRIMLVFKAGFILNEEIMFEFWDALMQKKEKKTYELFATSLEKLRSRVTLLPDKRSQELFADAIDWALKYPEEIYIHSSSQDVRKGHMPNMAAFPELLRGIERQSRLWQSKVHQIKHDRQSEFGETLKEWHERYKNASGKPIYLPGKEKYIVRRVEDSSFIISSAEESPGIQVSDIAMWLLKKAREGEYLPPNCSKVLRYLLRYSYVMDLSFETVSKSMSSEIDQLMNMEMSEEQIEAGKKLLEDIEENRQRGMREVKNRRDS